VLLCVKPKAEKLRAERVCKLENEDKRLHYFDFHLLELY
jgi:hypothetical protein